MPDDWRLFRGDNQRRDDVQFPDPPPWRRFAAAGNYRGQTFQASDQEIQMVNAALYLRRPLLITGPPGIGKSSLVYAVAQELQLGDVLRWPINSRSTLIEGLYRYDAVARLRDASLNQSRPHQSESSGESELDIGHYVTLGPLGTALLPSARPRVLLIDEIDKSDIDLPNDLLHVFEEGRFEIPELIRAASRQPRVSVLTHGALDDRERVEIERGSVEADAFPFVAITSNGERDLPPAFLRRCLRLEMPRPDSERLKKIVEAHLGNVEGTQVDQLIQGFLEETENGRLLAIDQLLNAIFLVTAERIPADQDWEEIRESLMRALDEE